MKIYQTKTQDTSSETTQNNRLKDFWNIFHI